MKRSVFVVVLVSALAGCAVGPDYARPDAPVRQAWKEQREWREARPADNTSRCPERRAGEQAVEGA